MFGLFTAIESFISSVVSVVGPVIARTTDILLNKLPPAIEAAKIIINIISDVVSTICDILDISSAEEKCEEIGAKIMQEDTRVKWPEESTEEYLNYLRNDVEFDQEKFDNMTNEEKLACKTLGATMKSNCIEEKFGIEISSEFLMTIAKVNMNADKVLELVKCFAKYDMESMDGFVNYLTNNMSEDDAIEVDTIVKSALKANDAIMTNEEIENEILNMKKDIFINNINYSC